MTMEPVEEPTSVRAMDQVMASSHPLRFASTWSMHDLMRLVLPVALVSDRERHPVLTETLYLQQHRPAISSLDVSADTRSFERA